MRAISLVKKVEFDFPGNVVRNALTLGDVDNDGCNELIVGNDLGDVAIFKGKEHFQTITKLSFDACLAVGDVTNRGKNSLVVLTANGWCYIYEVPEKCKDDTDSGFDQVDGQKQSSGTNTRTASKATVQSSSESVASKDIKKNVKENPKNGLVCVHVQRIPANIKTVVLGDIDGDGFIEMVVGLTDRVVRSYRWVVDMGGDSSIEKDAEESAKLFGLNHKLPGNLVGLTKWESANQIGSITLHHSLDGKPSILVAQPGGTFMRIKCQDIPLDPENHSNCSENQNFVGSVVDYQFLGISRMRNQNISTEILGDLKTDSSAAASDASSTGCKSNPYAVATLDGTIMLVQDEVILWAIAVDHQIFALTKVDITGNGCDDIVVCCWDGQTYVLDQNKNSVRFHLEEPVRAFHSGWYNLDTNEPPVTAMVYVTFKNTIVVYYDIPLKDFTIKKFEPDLNQLSQLFISDDRDAGQAFDHVKSMDKMTRKELIEFLLYSSNT